MIHFLIGPVPPPLGGISVYVSRRARQLREEGHRVINIDFSRQSIPVRALQLARVVLDPRPATIELHSFDFSAMAAALLRPFRKKVDYMDHNTLLYDRPVGGLRARILERFLRTADEVAFVSREGRDHYEASGFHFTRAVVRNAYLPPRMADEKEILETYDAETRAFLGARRPLIVANASQIVFVGNEDLYGLDMCAELVTRLRAAYPDVGLLFGLANGTENGEYLARIRKKIEQNGAAGAFHVLTGQRELWPAFRTADLMVRPTTGDGFAVSIAEAMELGCAVLASDAVSRPAGVTLFRNRDFDDFERKARAMLAMRQAGGA